MADTNEMTGGEAIARLLRAQGIGPMFGMGGFQLPVSYTHLTLPTSAIV